MESVMLPTLFKLTKTGAIQSYEVSTKGDTITVTQGQVDGLKQSYLTKCEGKNVGRSNETTGAEQAIKEAKAKHAKKVKAGYVLDPTGETVVLLPQKVKSYIGNEHKIVFPAIATLKYNGVNATYWLRDNGELEITSRGGDAYPAIPHLEPSIRAAMKATGTTCLNGELYVHDTHLQDIVSAVRSPKGLTKSLQFVVFDLPLLQLHYYARVVMMMEIVPCTSVFMAHHTIIKDVETLELFFHRAIASKHEGIVINNKLGLYRFNTRSSDVYKYKPTQDAEYIVTGYNLDKNNQPVFTCSTNGVSFKVKPKGTRGERLLLAEIAPDKVGDWLTVEYETLSAKGIPLKPVGLCFRNCSPSGRPLE